MIEHAYPAAWIATHHGCENRQSCKVEAYGRAAADLHNLWPAIASIKSSRQDQSLGEIPGEQQRRFQDYCPDYERTRGQEAIVEPRDAVKGDMARSILYMVDSYRLPLPANLQRDMLLRWQEQDPPDDTERWRNLVIEGLQGNANPYIPQRTAGGVERMTPSPNVCEQPPGRRERLPRLVNTTLK